MEYHRYRELFLQGAVLQYEKEGKMVKGRLMEATENYTLEADPELFLMTEPHPFLKLGDKVALKNVQGVPITKGHLEEYGYNYNPENEIYTLDLYREEGILGTISIKFIDEKITLRVQGPNINLLSHQIQYVHQYQALINFLVLFT